jgi:hypothetical protein
MQIDYRILFWKDRLATMTVLDRVNFTFYLLSGTNMERVNMFRIVHKLFFFTLNRYISSKIS